MPAPTPNPTLSDVAKAAGVSTATVSRCLNTPDRVVAETRQKVMDAVNHLGYSPNFAARVMAVRRTNTIGAIIPTMENAVFARGLQSFQEALRHRGYTLLLASSFYDRAQEETQIRTLVARGADALLLIGHDRSGDILKFLDAQNVPALVAWVTPVQGGLPAIGFDNRAAMRAMAEQVIALGHRSIGVISALTDNNDRARLRLDGIRDAARSAGLGGALTVVETSYGIDSGAAAFGQIMDSPQPPTVVMCGNDVLAVGAMKAAAERGLDVPGDVSVTGFDDLELARITSPELATVHVPHRAMGEAAAEVLVACLETGAPLTAAELPCELRLRGSLAAPRSD